MQDFKDAVEVVEYLEGLKEKPNGQFMLARIYSMAKQQQEEDVKRQKVVDSLNLSPKEHAVDVIFVNDMAIVEVEKKENGKKTAYFYPVVNGKRTNDVADSFDYALILALSAKYGVCTFAPEAIRRILQIERA